MANRRSKITPPPPLTRKMLEMIEIYVLCGTSYMPPPHPYMTPQGGPEHTLKQGASPGFNHHTAWSASMHKALCASVCEMRLDSLAEYVFAHTNFPNTPPHWYDPPFGLPDPQARIEVLTLRERVRVLTSSLLLCLFLHHSWNLCSSRAFQRKWECWAAKEKNSVPKFGFKTVSQNILLKARIGKNPWLILFQPCCNRRGVFLGIEYLIFQEGQWK